MNKKKKKESSKTSTLGKIIETILSEEPLPLHNKRVKLNLDYIKENEKKYTERFLEYVYSKEGVLFYAYQGGNYGAGLYCLVEEEEVVGLREAKNLRELEKLGIDEGDPTRLYLYAEELLIPVKEDKEG